jgi:hypothetical protein
MSLCPINVQTGIAQLTGPITSTLLNEISVANSPFIASFAPRTTAPSLLGNVIDESSDHTILYKGSRYQLLGGVQIATPIHKGFKLPSNPSQPDPDYELIIPFVNLQVIGTYPSGILLFVPIYNSGTASHAGYIQQLIDAEKYPVASLQTIFFEKEGDTTQTSFAYNTCVDYVNSSGERGNSTLRIYYFPNGINLQSADFQALTQILTEKNKVTVPPFYLPPVLRDNTMSTVTSFTFDNDGNKVPNATSDDGQLYTTQLSTAGQEFPQRFQYFTKPIQLSSSTFPKSCPYYTTTQYKCVPFDRLKDLSGNMVIPGGVTLDKIITTQKVQDESLTKSSLTTADVGETLGITAGIVVGGFIILYLGDKVLKILQS